MATCLEVQRGAVLPDDPRCTFEGGIIEVDAHLFEPLVRRSSFRISAESAETRIVSKSDSKTAREPVARPSRTRYPSTTMQALKARVQNGRLVLDVPTDRPEGEVVELRPVDDDDDDYSDEERAALHAALERGSEQARLGQVVDADEVIRGLLARR